MLNQMKSEKLLFLENQQQASQSKIIEGKLSQPPTRSLDHSSTQKFTNSENMWYTKNMRAHVPVAILLIKLIKLNEIAIKNKSITP